MVFTLEDKVNRYLFELKCFGIEIERKENNLKTIVNATSYLIYLQDSSPNTLGKIIIYYVMNFSQLLIDNYNSDSIKRLEECCQRKLLEFKNEHEIEHFDEDISSYMSKNPINMERLYNLIPIKVGHFTEDEFERMGVRSGEDIVNYCDQNNYHSLLQFTHKFL